MYIPCDIRQVSRYVKRERERNFTYLRLPEHSAAGLEIPRPPKVRINLRFFTSCDSSALHQRLLFERKKKIRTKKKKGLLCSKNIRFLISSCMFFFHCFFLNDVCMSDHFCGVTQLDKSGLVRHRVLNNRFTQ